MSTRLPVLLSALGLVAGLLLPSSPALAVEGGTLTLEAIYGKELSGPRVTGKRWTPDGLALTYLRDDREERVELWIADPAGGEPRALIDTKEMLRIAALDKSEVATLRTASYRWAPGGDALLFSIAGSLKLYRPGDRSIIPLAPAKSGIEYPAFSPKGDRVAFVFGNELWTVGLDGADETQLTSGGGETLLHGGVSYVYGEEFEVETGFAWSPDGRYIVFLETDEQGVPVYPLVDELELEASVTYQRYPKAGDPNPRVRVGVVHTMTGRVAWIDRSAEYVPRIGWADAETVAVQLMNRNQDELELVLADPATGRSRSVLIESDEHWVNVSDDLTFLAKSEDLLWTSERSGYRHIYRIGRDGDVVERLTAGDWEVTKIEVVDEERGWVYFDSNEANPMGQDLYRVSLNGGKRERLTRESGVHDVTVNGAATAFVDEHSSLTRPPRTSLREFGSGTPVTIHSTPSLEPFDLVEPQIVEITAADGAAVRIKLLVPREIPPGTRLPVLVYVYGGPRSPVVRDSFRPTTELFHQLLVQRGFVVAYVDDRTSARLGHLHEIALWRNWGPHVVADHRAAVEHLRSLPFVDPERMAVWGWSGGGYTTCYHLTHTGLFKLGVAVAPVTDWRLYDSIYTERYMGRPQDEPQAYAETSILEAAADLQGRLLVVHGSGDDNVHPQNTIRLVQALIEAGKPVDLMIYPNKRHSIRGTDARVHLFGKILRYLEDHL